jgi:type III secretion system low calcium response chaperone LcrH/SycD
MTRTDAETGTDTPSIEQGAALLQYLMSGQTLSTVLGHSLKAQEALYHLAYTLYGQAKYEEAMRMFAYLLTLNHVDRRFFSGLAACLQMQRRYQDALKYHGMASMLDLTDPEPVIHSAECHLALGDRAQARTALAYALDQARGHAVHHAFVPRLEAMRTFLDNEPAAGSSNATGGAAPANTPQGQENTHE